MLILSLFPGIDLLGCAFEKNGFCVVRGPELFLGQDIRHFKPLPNRFDGVIGGPPCQDFSQLRHHLKPTGYGKAMITEFARVVYQAQPKWWLMENVPRVPDLKIAGYYWQRIDIDQGWYEAVSRLRHYQFGSKTSRLLNIPRLPKLPNCDSAALANDDRDLKTVCKLQGLPSTFNPAFFNGESPFKKAGIKKVVGNGVPLIVGDVLAKEIKMVFDFPPLPTQTTITGGDNIPNRCKCPCKRSVIPPQDYYDYSCRKRMERRRLESKEVVTWPN